MSTATAIIRMTLSIGVSGLGAIHDRDSATPEMLIELADRCLYQSKKAGRSRATIQELTDASLTLQKTNCRVMAGA
jgi:GGDEF domain-containing protein